jgi:hypothetical protein
LTLEHGGPLTLPAEEAFEVIRRRRAETAKGVEVSTAPEGWQRAFEAVIIYYEKHGDADMADVLRLDFDRFVRLETAQEQVEWERKKEDKTA